MKTAAVATARILVASLALSLIFGSTPTAFAADLTMIADDNDLWFDPISGSQLFDVINMTPGDVVTSDIAVDNRAAFSFTLDVEIRNLGGNKPDPADKFIIGVYRNNVKLTEFSVAANGSYPYTYSYANNFPSGSRSDLAFSVTLPGPSTGNEYQGRLAELQWIFTARSEPASSPSPSPSPSSSTSPTRGGSTSDGSTTTGRTPEGPSVPSETVDNGNPPIAPPETPPEGSDAGTGEEEGVPQDKTPLAEREMPKTGQSPIWYNLTAGLVLMLMGIILASRTFRIGRA